MAVEHSAHYERMSLEEYLALVEQDPEHAYEYLDGRVYMMTGGSPDHSIIGSNLNGLLQAFLRGRRCIVYNSDVYVQLSEHYRVCPDVTVSCDPRDRGAQEVIRHPSLVAEVLSPPPKRAIAARSPCSIVPAPVFKNTCSSVLSFPSSKSSDERNRASGRSIP